MRGQYRRSARVVAGYIGALVLILGLIMLIPLLFVLVFRGEGESARTLRAFLIPALICISAGYSIRRTIGDSEPNTTQAMLICALGWLVLSAAGALPYVLGIGAGYIDAYFETMSGFTTTGITMFTGLDTMPHSIIFWRSLTQWVGGLGILTFFLAVSSRIPGAHLLFGAESHKITSGRPVPGMANTVKILWTVYTGFTVLIIALLKMGGMSIFDGLNHSFTALSTGGFSPYDASIAHFSALPGVNGVMLEYVLILGMILGGTSFLVHYRVLSGSVRSLWDNSEMKLWWTLIAVLTSLVLLDHLVLSGETWVRGEEAFRTSLFQTVSILTTTGFGTRDLTSPFFGPLAGQLFLVMMIIGGCVGSTAGGIKVQRVVILFRVAGQQLRKLVVPRNASNRILLDGKYLDEMEVNRVSAIFFIWIGLLVFGGAVTALLSNLDGYSSFSGMFSAMGNIGPCFISTPQIGDLNPVIKIIYIFGMLAGRLEILPLLLLFSPRAWRIW
ncbi:MAG: TrkH family potassium uptake protein [Candidatus Fermentibacteraceae bacterium]|nr:TrkH family potassium uptake protein [Candidatus Fermentibacteraceae bacterium]